MAGKPDGKSDTRGKLTLLGRPGAGRAAGSPGEAALECFANPRPGRDYLIRFDCPEFTSLCPVTGQPDFGRIEIEYVAGRWCVESKSLKLYLFAFRNQGCFGEALVNRILDDFVRACRPRRARVIGRFTPRGGIAITVSAEHPSAAGRVRA